MAEQPKTEHSHEGPEHGEAEVENHEDQKQFHEGHNQLLRILQTRHSVRAFLDKPVPRPLLEKCFHQAQFAASNSNIQPWRIHVVSGKLLKQLSSELTAAVERGEQPTTAPLPEKYKHYRSHFGHALYGEEGYNIDRDDKEGMRAAQLRNYNFFGATCAFIVSIDKALDRIDVLSVGLYSQTLGLLLWDHGIGTCLEASVAGYPQVIRNVIEIDENMDILCGVAVGYEDVSHRVNRVRAARNAWHEHVVFHED